MSCPFKQIVPSSSAAGDLSSSLKQAEVSLAKENTKLLYAGDNINRIVAFMQESPDAAFLLDHDGKVVYRNKAAQLMFPINLNGTSLCSVFSFTYPSTTTTTWDDLASNLKSEPQHHNVTVMEKDDGVELPFTLNLCKLPAELINDCFALAYIIPAHDEINKDGSPEKNDMQRISEECSTVVEEKQLLNRMKDVVNASLDPMLALTNDGKIIVANAAAVNSFGYSHDELTRGRSIATICPTAREVQNILNFMQQSAESLNKKQKTKATTKSGNDLSIELGISVNQNMSYEPIYFAHMKDLSEIEHKDEICQQMINSSFDPMFAIDQRGSILIVNEAACQAFGYTREEFVGQNIKIICNKHDAKHHDAHLQRYLSTGEKRVIGKKRELDARRKDATTFPVELGVSEVVLSNGEKMFCGYIHDKTQQRLDKQMLRRKEAVIQDKFFCLNKEDARGVMKEKNSRLTQ